MMRRISLSDWRRLLLVPAVVLLPVAGVPDSAHCGHIELTVTSHSDLIVEGRRGLLVTFEGLDSLAGMDIVYAKCQFALSADSCRDGASDVILIPIQDESVRQSPTGVNTIDSVRFSYAERFASIARVNPIGNVLLESLVTETVRSAVGASRARMAFTILPSSINCEFSFKESEHLPEGQFGRLIIKFVDKGR